MTRENKIELLKSLASGTASIEDIKEHGIDYSKLSFGELLWLREKVALDGEKPVEWTIEEKEAWIKIFKDLPNRESGKHGQKTIIKSDGQR